MKKIIIVENQTEGLWTNSTRSVVGVDINPDTKKFKLVHLKGCNLSVEGLLKILIKYADDMDIFSECYTRVNPYKLHIREGMSGCQTVYLHYLWDKGGFYASYSKELLHISCANKVVDFEIFIPDLTLCIDLLTENCSKEVVDNIKLTVSEPVTAEGYIIPQQTSEE